MNDFPRISKDHDGHDVADQETLREAAKSGYAGGSVIDISEALKKRDRQRAERERDAAKVHYLGVPSKPQP
jgi:hypothetical protein